MTIKIDSNTLSEEEKKQLAEQKHKEVWNLMGFTGEPGILCMYCHRPCEWDKEKDIILCTICGRDWTLDTMNDECERMLGIKK